jgi:lipopolysaccharide/colanic/teichoic acid biosynthesis glycosyltransferase
MFSPLQKQLASIIVQCDDKGPVAFSFSRVAEAARRVSQYLIGLVDKYQRLFQKLSQLV